MQTNVEQSLSLDRVDLLESLARHRYFLRFTVRDLTDEDAAKHTTASELCLGGLIKHVAMVEAGWAEFILSGPEALGGGSSDWSSEALVKEWTSRFQMLHGETLAGLLEHYDEVARRTDELVATLPDLDVAHRLPEAPWYEKGAEWSARRVLLHILAETAQHAGHADILRESLDGQKTMG